MFHVSLLKPFVPGDDLALQKAPPDPILIDGSAEFEIEKIVRHRLLGGRGKKK